MESNNREVTAIQLVLVCGLPGSGKSHLLYQVKKLLDDHASIITFDSYFNLEYGTDYDKFKQSREKFIKYIEGELIMFKEQLKSKAKVLFIEDNFPLKSARKQLYRFVQSKLISSYLEIHFRPNLDVCLHNNSLRKKNLVPPEIIKSMLQTYELPESDSYLKSIIIESGEDKEYETLDIKNLVRDVFEFLEFNKCAIKSKEEAKQLEIYKKIESTEKSNLHKGKESLLLEKAETQIRKCVKSLITDKSLKLCPQKISEQKESFCKELRKVLFNKSELKDYTSLKIKEIVFTETCSNDIVLDNIVKTFREICLNN